MTKIDFICKKHAFNMQIRINSIKKTRFIKLSTRHLQALLPAAVVLQI
jgi:hypothetical protein